MSRALALLLALCALVLPSIARAHARVDVRVPARAAGAIEASAVTTEYDTTGRPILVTHTEHGNPFSRGFQCNHLAVLKKGKIRRLAEPLRPLALSAQSTSP